MNQETIVLVSGLPRSGTSMMMKMLEAGGLAPLVDHIRTADEDNPKGYYEFERVKQIETDQAWLEEARGKVVKMIAALLKHLPDRYQYKVIFIRRNMDEILASQRQMLIRRGEPVNTISDEKMAALFERHIEQVTDWLTEQPNFETLYVHYTDIVQNPLSNAKRINAFLDGILDEQAMAEAVDPSLYRQRG